MAGISGQESGFLDRETSWFLSLVAIQRELLVTGLCDQVSLLIIECNQLDIKLCSAWIFDVFNPDFPLALVARVIKRLKMWEKNKRMCGRRSHSTLTNIF